VTAQDPNEFAKRAHDHAWNWFALHAAQRMQTFNFFLVATAFLVAGYASLLEKHRGAAAGIALLGAWIAFWFSRLDMRNRQFVKAAERALVALESQLFAVTGIAEIKIVEAVEQPAIGTSSYRRVIKVIQWTMFAVFLSGAIYAMWLGARIDITGVAKN
jgi:hypothetical protein